jgi:hypothetical protein
MGKGAKNNGRKAAKKTSKSPKKGRTPSFATFVKENSGNMYLYDKKRNVLRIRDGSICRDAKEDGVLSRFAREYKKVYPAK